MRDMVGCLDDFKDMVNPVYLGLESPGGYSRIYPLPPEIFRHLGGLRRLSLWKYDPDSVLDRDWATELPRLEVLTLRTAGDQPESAEWPGNTTYDCGSQTMACVCIGASMTGLIIRTQHPRSSNTHSVP